MQTKTPKYPDITAWMLKISEECFWKSQEIKWKTRRWNKTISSYSSTPLCSFFTTEHWGLGCESLSARVPVPVSHEGLLVGFSCGGLISSPPTIKSHGAGEHPLLWVMGGFLVYLESCGGSQQHPSCCSGLNIFPQQLLASGMSIPHPQHIPPAAELLLQILNPETERRSWLIWARVALILVSK